MLRHTRNLLLTFALVLLAAPAFAGDGSNLLQYVPGSAKAVAGINVDALRSTSLWTQVMANADSNADLQRSINVLKTDGGFDPVASIHSVVFATTQLSESAGDNGVTLIEVDYNADGLARVLLDDGYTAGTTGNIKWFRKGVETIAFLTPTVLAIGKTALVEISIAAAGGQEAGASGTVRRQIRAVDKSGALWLAAQLPAGMQGVQAARLSMNLRSGMRTQVNAVLESAEAAQTLVDQFNSQVSGAANAPEVAALGLAPLLSGVQVAADGAEVALTISLSEADWSNLLNTLSGVIAEQIR